MNSFVMSHFSYCPLVNDRTSYNMINKIHERALKRMHKDSTSNCEGRLIIIILLSVHQRNLQLLLNEIYKTINNVNPSLMAKAFGTIFVPYNLRGSTTLVFPKAGKNLYDIDTVWLADQKYGRLCQKKSKKPKHWRFSKEVLRVYLFIAASNCAKVLSYI